MGRARWEWRGVRDSRRVTDVGRSESERGRAIDVRARGSRNGGGVVAAAAVWMTGQDGARNEGEK